MIKNRKKSKNDGNSFIMVVATLSFLAVLVAAILVAVALSYKLKAYDINSKDNFYVLEQAMDEIYAGVGADSMQHLNDAYADTIEVIVYFDTQTQAYVTMENETANKLLKDTFIKLVKDDPNYENAGKITTHLNSFLSNPYSAGNTEGVQLSVGNVVKKADNVSVLNVILKREAEYSTQSTGEKGKKDTFIQTITTDLVISKPEFNVNFNTINANMDDLYGFAVISDMGMEVVNPSTTVEVIGNLYAASDFYNKDYNLEDEGDSNYIAAKNDEDTKLNYQKVNAYKKNDLMKCNGLYSNSMYSGVYVDGATLRFLSDRIIVPGTIAAMNSATVSVSSKSSGFTDVWADGIVLGGYSLKTNNEDNPIRGSRVEMNANAYIADDLELNAVASTFNFKNGNYYGYNYASLDNRTYTSACRDANGGRTFSKFTPNPIKDLNKDGTMIEGQDHYNSSSIIVNGNDSILDFGNVNSMYIAGQSYIEISKQKEKKVIKDPEGNPILVDGKVATAYDEYKYKEYDDETNDYYTVINKTDSIGNSSLADKSNLQDYRTGEAISVKSNQLAYSAPIPNSWIKDDGRDLYLTVNEKFYNDATFLKDYWEDLSKIPVVKSVVSGKAYYFFDFSKVKEENQKGMNEFIAEYSNLFKKDGNEISKGEKYGLTDITNYDDFTVKELKLKLGNVINEEGVDQGKKYTDSIYTNSAITIKDGTSLTIKSKSESKLPLIAAATYINSDYRKQHEASVRENALIGTDGVDAAPLAKKITSNLQNQYKEVKWMLTTTSHDVEGIKFAHDQNESDISPINYFFDLTTLKSETYEMESKYKVWLCNDDRGVTIEPTHDDGRACGVIISKSDVTFSDDVKNFDGLIVCGGKVKVSHTMNFNANPEIVKSILDECDKAFKTDKKKNAICALFKQYDPINKDDSDPDKVIETETMKKITAVQFEDILAFENWKKNVD